MCLFVFIGTLSDNRDPKRIFSFFTWKVRVRPASRLCWSWGSADLGSSPSPPLTYPSTWASFCPLQSRGSACSFQPHQKATQVSLGPRKYFEKKSFLAFRVHHFTPIYVHIFFLPFKYFFFYLKKKSCKTNLAFLPALTHWLEGKLT